MVKTRVSEHAKINKKLTNLMINSFFGKTLVLSRPTITKDNFGDISDISYANTSFTGDLQVYPNVDEQYLDIGMVKVGEGVLYIHPDALTSRPQAEDLIVDGSAEWEVITEIEAPTLNGTVCHYSYKVRRRVNSNDT